MDHQPTPTSVGAMYDCFSSLLTDSLGGSIHVGYWDDPAGNQDIQDATDRLTEVAAGQLALTPGQRILDVGCGTGKPAIQIATTNDIHITGITISDYQLELAQALRIESNLQPTQISFQFANALDLPFANASFDGAYAIESLSHISDKYIALTNISRVLRPNGRLVIADAFLDKPIGDIQDGDSAGLVELLQLFQISSICTADDYRKLLHDTGFDNIKFTDIRHNTKPTYGIFAAALRKKALTLDGNIKGQLESAIPALEQFAQVGYALITAERV